jgi:hypothetical protein
MPTSGIDEVDYNILSSRLYACSIMREVQAAGLIVLIYKTIASQNLTVIDVNVRILKPSYHTTPLSAHHLSTSFFNPSLCRSTTSIISPTSSFAFPTIPVPHISPTSFIASSTATS